MRLLFAVHKLTKEQAYLDDSRLQMRNPVRNAVLGWALLFICLATVPGVGARGPCNTCVCHGPVEEYVAPPCTPSCSLLRKT